MLNSDTGTMILPGATLGMLGGGQLGRMFVVAARTMGYRVLVLDPDADSPAGQIADIHLKADYHDSSALADIGSLCAAVTTEFENIPADVLEQLAGLLPVRPGAAAVRIAQDRIAEKSWLRDHGFATAPFAVVQTDADLTEAVQQVGFPAILKVARFGYDGKGQAVVRDAEQAASAFAGFAGQTCILERRVELQTELSVVLARNACGQTACFPVAENLHRNGILDISIAPARIGQRLQDKARQTALDIAGQLAYQGVLGVEFFITRDGSLLVNEMAPRPHNSGHYTLDACRTDQFQLQVRALCNLPLGATELHTPAVMVNLLGDLWQAGTPEWQEILRHPQAKLHLYGKRDARPGRKMGHFTCLAGTADAALKLADIIRRQLNFGRQTEHTHAEFS